MNGNWKVRLLGGLRIDRDKMKIEINDAPLEWQIITQMALADLTFERADAAVLVKHTELSDKVLDVWNEVCRLDPPPAMAQPAEHLEHAISTIAFGRLTYTRNALFGKPESEAESLGAVKMLLTLDALDAIDVDLIDGLLGGPVITRPWENADYDDDEEDTTAA